MLSRKRVIVAAVLVVAFALTAYVGYVFWWVYGPWPWGTVVAVQGPAWVVIQTEVGARYRAWVPEQYRSDSLLGSYMEVHTVGSPFSAEPIPW